MLDPRTRIPWLLIFGSALVLEMLAGIAPVKRRKLVAMTISLDRAVGRVLESLREHDLRRDTLIVFSSDHGDACGDHGRTGL